jgi:hypothetical protein
MMRSASVLLPWSMWAMIEKLRIHLSFRPTQAAVTTAKPLRRSLTSRSEVKVCEADRRETKKRHVEWLTRLPTERLATACWAFIVVKRTGLEAAPVLVFGPLRGTNMKSYQQDVHSPDANFGLQTGRD